MSSHLIRKLERFGPLSFEDKQALSAVVQRPLRNIAKGTDLIREGDWANDIRILLSGWALRYKQLRDGRRQVISMALPADVCDLNVFSPIGMDHSIVAATPLVIAVISRESLISLLAEHPSLMRALSYDFQLSIGLLHDSIISIGQRTALERVANLFCGLCIRLELIGCLENLNFHFPLTQSDIAAATGLSVVHVNRTLGELRRMHLISLVSKKLHILDLQGLRSVALFNPAFMPLPPLGDAGDKSGGIVHAGIALTDSVATEQVPLSD
jgi:CRP-like cAMP-binding protein